MSNTETPIAPAESPMLSSSATVALTAAASAALAACGGGGDSSTAGADTTGRASAQALNNPVKPTSAQAWRFLNQASMGGSAEDIKYITTNGYDAWLNQQFALPTTSFTDDYINRVKAIFGGAVPPDATDPAWAQASWWKQALNGKDQLRQRVTFALSEIIVNSLVNNTTSFYPIMIAGWQDLLNKGSFGSYRDLIEGVSKNPAMGFYLSHFGNTPPDRVTGRIPDQNYAREVTQLFTIGLIKLDMYGKPVLDIATGQPLKASSTSRTDIRVLSHVFTGWTLGDSPDTGNTFGFGGFPTSRNDRCFTVPMRAFTNFHATDADVRYSVAQQTGEAEANVVVKLWEQPFTMGATPQASLTKVLDILFGPVGDSSTAHQNVAPFIAKQMIQRLVTSNPSANYIYRVATAFKNSYWSLKTLVRAILLDDEARLATYATGTAYGKVREPLLRVTHLLRAFKAVPANPATYSGLYIVSGTNNAYDTRRSIALNQAPYAAPSVFNYFSPGFRINQSNIASQGKVAPEMQLVTETTTATYINAVYDIISGTFFNTGSELKLDFTAEVALIATPASVVASINTKLFGGAMSTELVSYLVGSFTAAGASTDARTKVQTAVLLAMASPEYLVQK